MRFLGCWGLGVCLGTFKFVTELKSVAWGDFTWRGFLELQQDVSGQLGPLLQVELLFAAEKRGTSTSILKGVVLPGSSRPFKWQCIPNESVVR